MQRTPDRTAEETSLDHTQSRHRRLLKVVLALAVIWYALDSSAASGQMVSGDCPICESPAPALAFDDFTPLPAGRQSTPVFAAPVTSVEVRAGLANLDADASPDGWRAEIVLRDRYGLLTAAPARATIELLTVHPPVRWRPQAGDVFDAVSTRPLARWSERLTFDARSVATVNLPVTRQATRALGWRSSPQIHIATRGVIGPRLVGRRGKDRYFVTDELRDRIDHADRGWLRVRVSVPGSPRFEAITSVSLR